jgi:hypothetical protein
VVILLLLSWHWKVLQIVHDGFHPHLFSYNSFTWLSINSVFYIVIIRNGRTRSLLPYLPINDVGQWRHVNMDLTAVTNVGLWCVPISVIYRYHADV